MKQEDLQEAIYQAAKRNDRAAVNGYLKDFILTDDRDDDTKLAFAVTIDIATKNMSTLSLLVLSFQGGAHGLFRHLAEKEPENILKLAPPLVAAFGDMSFVKPIAALGADKSFMEGGLLVKAVTEGDLDMVQWMIAQGVDVNSTGTASDKPLHPMRAAESIESAETREKMKAVIFEAGIATATGTGREALEAYDAERQERSASETRARLKSHSSGKSLRL